MFMELRLEEAVGDYLKKNPIHPHPVIQKIKDLLDKGEGYNFLKIMSCFSLPLPSLGDPVYDIYCIVEDLWPGLQDERRQLTQTVLSLKMQVDLTNILDNVVTSDIFAHAFKAMSDAGILTPQNVIPIITHPHDLQLCRALICLGTENCLTQQSFNVIKRRPPRDQDIDDVLCAMLSHVSRQGIFSPVKRSDQKHYELTLRSASPITSFGPR